MTRTTLFLSITSLSLAALAPVFALQNQPVSQSDYHIIAYKDCKQVFQQPMSDTQIKAYHELTLQTDKMDELELGLDGINDEIAAFTQKIESITDLAIQETGSRLTIDKNLLAEQQQIVAELERFMDQHEHRFDALGEHGEILGQYADVFTDAIEADLAHVDYDNVRVITPDNLNDNHHCTVKSISM